MILILQILVKQQIWKLSILGKLGQKLALKLCLPNDQHSNSLSQMVRRQTYSLHSQTIANFITKIAFVVLVIHVFWIFYITKIAFVVLVQKVYTVLCITKIAKNINGTSNIFWQRKTSEDYVLKHQDCYLTNLSKFLMIFLAIEVIFTRKLQIA